MDEREIRRFKVWKETRIISRKCDELVMKLNKTRADLMTAKREYESLDRELMMEKRTVIAPQGTVTRTYKPPKMTIEQVRELAERLGVEVMIEE